MGASSFIKVCSRWAVITSSSGLPVPFVCPWVGPFHFCWALE